MPKVTGKKSEQIHSMQVPDSVWQRAQILDPLHRRKASVFLRELLIQRVTEMWELHSGKGIYLEEQPVEQFQPDAEEPTPDESGYALIQPPRREVMDYVIRRERRAELRSVDRWSMSVRQWEEVESLLRTNDTWLSLRNHDNTEVYRVHWEEIRNDPDVVEEFYHQQVFYLIHAGWAWHNKKPGVIRC